MAIPRSKCQRSPSILIHSKRSYNVWHIDDYHNCGITNIICCFHIGSPLHQTFHHRQMTILCSRHQWSRSKLKAYSQTQHECMGGFDCCITHDILDLEFCSFLQQIFNHEDVAFRRSNYQWNDVILFCSQKRTRWSRSQNNGRQTYDSLGPLCLDLFPIE